MEDSKYLYHLEHQTQWPQLHGHDKIVYSKLRNWDVSYHSETLAIKYVIKGTEHYYLDRCKHSIQPGSFLLVNAGRDYHGKLNNPEHVHGLCITFRQDYLADAALALNHTEDQLLDMPDKKKCGLELVEKIYNAEESTLGHMLTRMAGHIHADDCGLPEHPQELYLALSGHLLAHQHAIGKQVDRLPSTRRDTRVELYKRLETAREFIESTYRDTMDLDTLAEVAGLSSYHFLRSFRKLHKATPYQYLLATRLRHARRMLLETDAPVMDIAFNTGFADISSFSRAFKRHFGYAPTKVRAW